MPVMKGSMSRGASPGSIAAVIMVLVLLAIPRGPLLAQTLRPRTPQAEAVVPLGVDGSAAVRALTYNSRRVLVALRTAAEAARATDSLVRGFIDAARLARDSAAILRDQLALYAKTPDVFQAADSNRLARMTVIAAIALDKTVLNDLVGEVTDPGAKSDIRREAAAIQRQLTRPAPGTPIVSLFADGTIRGAVNGQGDAGTQSAGTGSVGLGAAWPSGWQLMTSVTVASTVDTVKNGAGSVVLIPGAGKSQISTFIVEFYAPRLPGKVPLRFHGYLSGGNSVWEARIDTTTKRENAAVLGLGLGLYQDVLCTCRLLNTEVGITTTEGLALRILQGNAAQADSFLQQTLNGASNKRYWGAELGLTMTIGAVRAGVQYYHIRRAKGKIAVPSLTGGQLVIGLSVAGNIVSGPVSRP